jgi:hypothetical protein
MRGISGYAIVTGPLGVKESDTFNCFHCGHVEHVHFGQRQFTRCGHCSQLICPQCIGKGCKPFEKKLEAQLRAMELYQAARNNR